LYHTGRIFTGLSEYSGVINASTIGILILIVATFFLRPDQDVSRTWLLLAWSFVMIGLGILRFGFRRMVYALRSRGALTTSAIMVGLNDETLAIAHQLASRPRAGVRVLGFVDDDYAPGHSITPGVSVLGPVSQCDALALKYGVSYLILAGSTFRRDQLLDLYRASASRPQPSILLSSGVFEIISTGLQQRELASVPLVTLDRLRITGFDLVLKTVFDYVLASVLLTLAAPLLAVVAVVIKLDSRGPILYRRRVVGLGDRDFDALKLRSMVEDSQAVLERDRALRDAITANGKAQNDPRITRIGRLIRRTSVDELPQLINVLRGEMSLVGPRMLTRQELNRFGKWRDNIFTVKPGLTGLWQVSGRSNLSYEDRVRLDMYYVRNHTLWLDLAILLKTFRAVLRGSGAY
jgi:exopolysaccharide biosynthesis polyprenyl glycosylphosphotransferase